MDDGKSEDAAGIKAPTYLELVNLVALLKEQTAQSLTLRAEVESLRKVIRAGNVSEPVDTPVTVAAPTMRPEYRVVPDLSREMTSFSGNETPLQADDWLEEIKGMTSLNRWPFEYVLQYVGITYWT
ncbi:hypothetical protein ACI65C_001873 [Semiaphis heraclei]